MADVSKIKLPSGTTYTIKDNNALPLTGGSVTGPVSFGDTVTIDEATIGDLVVSGNGSFTNNIQANTINGVEVGATPSFTDTITTVTTTGSGNAVTAITASNGALTVTKGSTFSTSDTKVTQSYKTASEYVYWRPLLIGYSSGSAASFTPSDQTNLAYTFETLKVQPSTGTIRVNNLALYKGSYTTTFTPTTLTADRTITIPNNTGTMALTSDIPSVPAWALESSKPSYTFSEIGSKPTTISGYGITDAYTKTEVDNKVSAVLRYKGVKAAVANLPTSGNTTGDVWHVTATSGEYAWDGTEWQELGTAVSIPAATGSSTTGITIAAHGTGTVIGVQSTTTTASKVTVGSHSTDYGVKSAGSASTWTFEEKTIPNVTSAGTASSWTFEEKTIPNVTAAGSGSASLTFAMDTTDTKKLKITFSHTHTAPTIGTAITVQSKSGGSNGTAPTLGTAITVQSKSGGANSTAPTLGSKVPTVSASDVDVPIKNSSASTFVTGTTHTITDNGHTHSI